MKKSVLLLLTISECFIDYYIIFNASIGYASKTIQLAFQYTFLYTELYWDINSISEPLMNLVKKSLKIVP